MKNFYSLLFLFLVGCSFDPSGWGNNPTITDSGPEMTSSVTTGTTLVEVTTSSGSSSSSTTESLSTSSGELLDNTSSSDSSGTSSSSDSSSSSSDSDSSSGGSSSGGSIDSCGDCLLERAEECDVCNYGIDHVQSYCASSDSEFEKCTIGFNNLLGFITTFGALNGMQTAKYDQEEADILCKIFLHSVSSKATSFNINMGYSPVYSFISPVNIQGNGTLLKSATKYYPGGPLYFFEYSDIPFNQNLDSIFYVFGCQVI